jgi:hypothetical protein
MPVQAVEREEFLRTHREFYLYYEGTFQAYILAAALLEGATVELVEAGVMLAGEGLYPSAKGARVKFSGNQRSVTVGPFSETKELIAGFWIFQVASLQECIKWVKCCPNPMPGESEIEIRQLFEAADFGAEFTPELREQEARIRARIDLHD